ncbi:MAG: A/G-specific adenine glycosylase [Parcubacteria group bacterium]|nr:A/G-specific adenine glycosylase [Parcubacteria group bacterium]
MLSAKKVLQFQKIIYAHYKKHGRKLPWRPPALKLRKDKILNPYKILVSEVMLQQTQVSRVIKKYPLFIKEFKTGRALARAPLSKVLSVWSGLGYNRRAKFLHHAAKKIIEKHAGVLPRDAETLMTLPGVGPGTAGAVMAFAFNTPSIFIETNIRSVFIHYFFPKRKKVSDKEILQLIKKTIDNRNVRDWYYALMDYGVMLKEKHKNPSRKSAHYVEQSPFKNSNRQVRGEILKLLTQHKSIPKQKIKKYIKGNQKYINSALEQLLKEKFIRIKNNVVTLA